MKQESLEFIRGNVKAVHRRLADKENEAFVLIDFFDHRHVLRCDKESVFEFNHFHNPFALNFRSNSSASCLTKGSVIIGTGVA